MNQPETGIHSKKVEIIDPHHLCPEGIDDLFVHHLFLEKDDILFRKRCLKVQELFFRKGELGLDLNDLLPGKVHSSLPLVRIIMPMIMG